MNQDIIWALDQRDRCIACPSNPVANAVVLHLRGDGQLARTEVAEWARDGVMAAGVAWPGAVTGLTEADWLDLEDAVTGLSGLAQVVALYGDTEVKQLLEQLSTRTNVGYVGSEGAEKLRHALIDAAPV